MTPVAASKSLTEESIAALRRRPGFGGACDAAARAALGHFQTLPPFQRWVNKDLGRGSIALTAIILASMEGLTVRSLVGACVAQGVSSPGRVTQLVRRAEQAGDLAVADGEAGWTRRPIVLGDVFLRTARERLGVELGVARQLAPEFANVSEIVADEAGYLSFVVALGTIITLRRDLFSLSRQPPLNAFLNREAGIHILWELMIAQPPERARLLIEAPISRNALARRYEVSRAHINKLIADCGHARADGDRVTFSAELSDALERHQALFFSLYEAVGRCLLGGWRYEPR